MSSPPPPPPPPPPGPPPPGSPPPPPPPCSSLPPPPPPSSANYFFAFVITFIVLLLLFVGCGVGTWRRRRPGEPSYSPTGRKRRRPVRPVFMETWTQPSTPLWLANKGKWEGVQPISVAFVWLRSKRPARPHRARASSVAPVPTPLGQSSGREGVMRWLESYVCPRTQRQLESRPPSVDQPLPEAIQVTVMIAMPSPPSKEGVGSDEGARYVGHAKAGEYEMGIVRIPWPSEDASGT